MKERLECANCWRKIRPKSELAMKDKDGRVFCDVICACDFYNDTMRLAYVKWDNSEEEDLECESKHRKIKRIVSHKYYSKKKK